eukprot:CAMPEP_0194267322 /NCGR_PEP_ID=MMETSP0169-20130528/1876_1 /TAXON_ID=218684 /ORGANISM="Corethron pennatum, Strain L29A3" /LENGTH=255 /DNA_ID=CAMNT_0039008147 /DNA_START=81 /DNA_END=847 /DNA_ORIENTATION=-
MATFSIGIVIKFFQPLLQRGQLIREEPGDGRDLLQPPGPPKLRQQDEQQDQEREARAPHAPALHRVRVERRPPDRPHVLSEAVRVQRAQRGPDAVRERREGAGGDRPAEGEEEDREEGGVEHQAVLAAGVVLVVFRFQCGRFLVRGGPHLVQDGALVVPEGSAVSAALLIFREYSGPAERPDVFARVAAESRRATSVSGDSICLRRGSQGRREGEGGPKKAALISSGIAPRRRGRKEGNGGGIDECGWQGPILFL